MREKYTSLEESQQKEMELLEKDIQLLTVDNEQLERKFNAIQRSNERQFEDICQMTEEKLEQLFKQALRIPENPKESQNHH